MAKKTHEEAAPAPPAALTDLDRMKIHAALQRIDITRPGAVADLDKVQSDPLSPASEYERLATEYPLTFVLPAATADEADGAMAVLSKKYEDKALRVSARAGRDINYEDPERIDTGNLTLNWLTGGGFPRGWLGQIKGPESRGKTYVMLKTSAEVLRRGGRVLWVAAERFSKPWARQLGVTLPYSDREMFEDPRVTPELREQMKLYNTVYGEAGSRFVVATGTTGNEVLQYAADAIAMNTYDLVVVDSLAVLRNSEVIEKHGVGDRSVGGEASMIGDFCSRAELAFNSVEKANGKVLTSAFKCLNCNQIFDKETKKLHKSCNGKPKFEEAQKIGGPVRSAVVVINQVRTQGVGSGKTWMDAPGGMALKHAKGYDIDIARAMDLSTTYQGELTPYGRRIIVTTDKSKICPPHREGIVELWYKSVPGVSVAGAYSLITELVGAMFGGGENQRKYGGIAEQAGLITCEAGGRYNFAGQSFHGMNQLANYLSEPQNAPVVVALRSAIQKWIQENGRY